MQRSYLVKSPVHFADFGFFVKVGDILVHDTSNANRLTVYRGGEVVRAVKQTALGLAAMQKSGFIEEVTQSKPASKAPAKPVEPPKPAPKKEEAKPAVAPSKPPDPKPTPKPEPKPATPEPKKEEPPKVKAKAAEVEDDK